MSSNSFKKSGQKFDKKLLYTHKFEVDFEECEVLGSETITPPAQPDLNLPWATVLNPDTYNKNTKGGYLDYTTYVRFKKDKMTFIGGPFDKSVIGVKAAIIRKKTTFIYYDPVNPANYYFDLSFIEK